MDKIKLKTKLTEIVAVRVDIRDQNRGKNSLEDPYRWQERYAASRLGFKDDDRHFKIEVDQFVAMIMSAMEEPSAH